MRQRTDVGRPRVAVAVGLLLLGCSGREWGPVGGGAETDTSVAGSATSSDAGASDASVASDPSVAADADASLDAGPTGDAGTTADVSTTGDASTSGDEVTPEDTTSADDPTACEGGSTGNWPDEHCGNCIVDPGEECDVGSNMNGDPSSGCSWYCRLNECGDGYHYEVEEECDDLNADETDYCLSTCILATCGDGFVRDEVEECDDGPSTGDGNSLCGPTCLLNTCGDAYLHATEGCDDGAATGDGVSACGTTCEQNTCGDSYVHSPTEACDPGGSSVTCDDCDALVVPVVGVALGQESTCVLFEPGVVRCWGASWPHAYSASWEDRAADVLDLDLGGTVVQIEAGPHHACAVRADGEVRCWGRGKSGELGYGTPDFESPEDVGSVDVGAPVVQVALGYQHTCALLDTGEVRCWGAGGVLGYGDTESIGDDETPATAGIVELGGTVAQIAAGYGHTCALLETGPVRCWGANADGQLGYGNTEPIGDDETPVSAGDVDVGGSVVQIAAGNMHTCALLEGGSVRCWGFGAGGRLGYANQETIGDDETPAMVGDVDVGGSVVSLDAGEHTCAVLETGALRCWGWAWDGALGYGDYYECSPDGVWCALFDVGDDETPAAVGDVPVAGNLAAERVSAGSVHTCAIFEGGVLRCRGSGQGGMLGYGDYHGKLFADENVPL